MRLDMIDQDLLSIQEARILAENARDAQLRMASFSQSKLDAIVEALAAAVAPHCKELAMRSADETDYGNWQDKLLKNRFVCEYLPRELRPLRCVGVIGEDPAHGITDVGVPAGVILALPPATSPVSTAIYNVLIAIKSGNAVIIAPHPRAARVSAEVMDLLITAGIAAGLPEGAIAYLQTLTKAGTEALMNHDDIALILITGVPAMLAAAQQSGKRVIYGGAGNGPAFIEKTADLEQAVCDIITSKTFDNGVVSAAEQAVVVDGAVEAAVRGHFIRHGAYFMNADEAERLGQLFYYKDGSANPEPVGKTALELARRAHIEVPLETTVLIAEQKYVSLNNP
ncbi:MAG: aldehyde dehydrogenase family protein, partial [Peptococcaceae bacterium]|nr:aldehyde dehydrogenase family protein [Peptococcaceae bacterium]